MRTYFYGTKNHPEVEKIQKKILISNISGNSDMLQYIELLVIQANIYRIHGKDIYSKTFEEIKNSIKRFKDHSDRKYIDILDLMEKALGSHDNSLFEDLKKIKEYHWGKEIQTIIEDLEESPINQLELKNIRLSWEKLLEESPELQRESKKIMDMIKGILQKLIERIISLFK